MLQQAAEAVLQTARCSCLFLPHCCMCASVHQKTDHTDSEIDSRFEDSEQQEAISYNTWNLVYL